jgi:prepilin-type N-terminal cleavage/methylation domain-containing protein
MHDFRGFTLLEICLTLSLMLIFASLGTTSFHRLYLAQQEHLLQRHLLKALSFARVEAIHLNQAVTISPTPQWRNGWIVTADNKHVLAQFKVPQTPVMMISWKSFPQRQWIRFLPTGTTDYQNGRFTITYPLARTAIIINQSGRVRTQEASKA